MYPNLEQDSSVQLDSDAILQVASYHRRDFHFSVTRAGPGQHDDIRSSFFKMLAIPDGSSVGLGRLQPLPLELLSSICLRLDVRSAFNFSQANLRAREVIASIPQYRRLGEHALECLWILFRTGLAPHISVSALHSALSAERCGICGSFGGFIFLPTASRCCYQCIEAAPAFGVVSLRSLDKDLNIGHARLDESLPVFQSLPGTYSLDRSHQRRRRWLVSGSQAHDFLQKNQDEFGLGPTDLLRATSSRFGALRCMASTWLPYVNLETGESQLGRACKGCCIAMQANACVENIFRQERVYSREEFLDHFQECEEANELWLSSEGGTVEVEEPVWTRTGGYLDETTVIPLHRHSSGA